MINTFCIFLIMDVKLTVLIHIIFGILGAHNTQGRKCYVCSDDGDVPCKDFALLKEKYIKECSLSESGCLLKTEGNKISRSCEQTLVQDCKVANEIEYCFCAYDLCNSNSGTGKFVTPTDDEDLLEGSGVKTTSVFTEKANVSVIITKSLGFRPLSSIIFVICSVIIVMA